MRWDQYSHVLQLAAALSLAGWVARAPESQLDPYAINSQYSGFQDARYHPYENFNSNGFYDNYEPAPMVQQGMFPNPPPGPHSGSIYNSKEAEDSFRAYLELQELISWQEAYRRGDLRIGNNAPQVLPVINKQGQSSSPFQLEETSPHSIISDDGYSSAGASVGSPSPTILSDLSVGLDDQSDAFSPFSDTVFDPQEFNFDNDFHGATGFTPTSFNNNEEVDIDKILGIENTLDESDLAKLDSAQRPFANLKGIDDDLEYVNSPLKNPTFDEFLGSPMPEKKPLGSLDDHSFDDPFNMRFTNSSGSNKFISSDTLLEFGDLNPSTFETPLDDDDIDEALVASLSRKYAKATSTLPLIPTDSIKKEFPYPYHHVGDHDYQKPDNLNQLHKFLPKVPVSPTDLMRLNQRPSHTPQSVRSRTFAPSVRNAKVKQQHQKSALIWPDFPYTADELVIMSVETFNEVIKKLDVMRQHIAKDMRRKGKNKLAARTCRKRKMDTIEILDTGVTVLGDQRSILLEERRRLLDETSQIHSKTEWLNDYIFEHLRDANGTPYSTDDYSLQYTSDGNVYLVPSGIRSSPKRIDV